MAGVQIPRAIDIRERIVNIKAELKTLRKLLKIADQAEAAESFSDVDGPVFCDKAPPGSPDESEDVVKLAAKVANEPAS